MEKTIKLTKGEKQVLAALYESASGNGHDFGFTEDARAVVKSPRELAGFVSQLVQKGLIDVWPTERIGDNLVTQFTWPSDSGYEDDSRIAHVAMVKKLLEEED